MSRVLFFALLLLSLNTVSANAETVDRIVAIVNDEIITTSDMKKYADRLLTGGLTDDLLVPDEAARQELTKNSDKLLQKMIEEKLIDSEIKRQNLSVPIERVEQEIRTVAKRNNVSRDELKAALAERGVSFSQYQDFIKKGLERQSLIEKSITSKIKVSEDDVNSALAAQLGRNADQAFEYSLSHIYFQSSKGGEEAARERAIKAHQRLRDGSNFEKLAGEISEDPGYEQGGTLGVFKTGELQKELESAVAKLSSGEFTGVLPTRGGFHIVKLTKKRPIADPRLDKDREKIRAQLYEKAYKRQLQGWLEQMRREAFIRINQKAS